MHPNIGMLSASHPTLKGTVMTSKPVPEPLITESSRHSLAAGRVISRFCPVLLEAEFTILGLKLSIQSILPFGYSMYIQLLTLQTMTISKAHFPLT